MTITENTSDPLTAAQHVVEPDHELDGYVDAAPDPVRPPKRERLLTKGTLLLGAAVIAVGGVAAGAHFRKTVTVATPAASGAARAGAGAGGAGTGAGGAGTGAGGANAVGGGAGATVGQVKLLDGSNLYVADNQGNVVKIATSANTVINVSAKGALAQLSVGENVVVQGTAGTDGTVTAVAVNAGPGFTAGRQAGATPSQSAGSPTATVSAGAPAGSPASPTGAVAGGR